MNFFNFPLICRVFLFLSIFLHFFFVFHAYLTKIPIFSRWNGTENGKFVSMGVMSDGSYGVPKDIVFSFPVTIENKQWKIVQGLSVDDFSRSKFDITATELLEEKEEATAVCKL